MADCQREGKGGGKNRSAKNKKKYRGLYPSPSLGCFLVYITINAVLVCAGSRCERWAAYMAFCVLAYRRPELIYYFKSSGCASRCRPLLVGRAPSVHVPLPHQTLCLDIAPPLLAYIRATRPIRRPAPILTSSGTLLGTSAKLGCCRPFSWSCQKERRLRLGVVLRGWGVFGKKTQLSFTCANWTFKPSFSI